MPGSEPPPGAGSVMAKDERTLPSTIGRSQRSFWAGVPARASRFMLPSSGAMQLNASGPNRERAASSYIAAQATMGSAMPPNSLGDCGAHSPAAFAFFRTGSSRSLGMFSCSEKFSGSRSSGSTCCSTKARVRSRRSSISGDSVKSMMTYPLSATIWPPSTTIVAPAMKRPASEASSNSAPSRSPSRPKRPTGMSRVSFLPSSLAR